MGLFNKDFIKLNLKEKRVEALEVEFDRAKELASDIARLTVEHRELDAESENRRVELERAYLNREEKLRSEMHQLRRKLHWEHLKELEELDKAKSYAREALELAQTGRARAEATRDSAAKEAVALKEFHEKELNAKDWVIRELRNSVDTLKKLLETKDITIERVSVATADSLSAALASNESRETIIVNKTTDSTSCAGCPVL